MENKTRINIPKLNADDIVEKAALVRVQELDSLINDMVDSLSKASNGKNLSKYWKTQDELIKDVVKSHKEYNKVSNDVNASNLLKYVNALKAVHGIDLSDILPDFNNIEKSIQSASRQINLDSAFDVRSFKDVFAAFEMMKSYGLDVQKIFDNLEINPDVEKLKSDLRNAEHEVDDLKVKANRLQEKLDQSESGNGIRVLREELDRCKEELEDVRINAEKTFSTFLESHNISRNQFEAERYFEEIAKGYTTAEEAIASFKRTYGYLLEENVSFDSTQLQDFSKRLEDVLERVTKVSEKIDEISLNGVKVSDSAAVGDVGNIEKIVDAVAKIGSAGESGDTSATYEALAKILTIIKEIGQVDSDSLYSLSKAIEEMSHLGDLKINKASLENLADCIQRICRINDTSALSSLSNVDFKKFNDLKISKASLRNLAEYLPQIANINTNTLFELSQIDFSNLSNLKIDKASLEGLRNFAESLRGVVQENDVKIDQADVLPDEIIPTFTDVSIENSIRLQDDLGREIDDNNSKLLKGTKLIDEQNKGILTLYHNSDAVFDKFDSSNSGKNQGTVLGNGNYLSIQQDGIYNSLEYGKYQTQWYANVQKILDVQNQKLGEEEAKYLIDQFKKINPNKSQSWYDSVYNKLTSGNVVDGLSDLRHQGIDTSKVLKELGYDAIKDGGQINIFDDDSIIRACDAILDISHADFTKLSDLFVELKESENHARELKDNLNKISNPYSGKSKSELDDDLINLDILNSTIGGETNEIVKLASAYKNSFGELPDVMSISSDKLKELVSNYEMAEKENDELLASIKQSLQIEENKIAALKSQLAIQEEIVKQKIHDYLYNETSQAETDFISVNEDVKKSAEDSKTPLQLEAELMDQIAKSAREAAEAKKEFVEANRQLKESADSSTSSLEDENEKLNETEENAKPKKDKYAKRNKISEETFLDNYDNYSSMANERLKSSGHTILGETVNTELVNGLVKVTAKVKDADGTWKSFSARIDADGNMFEQRFKAVTKGVEKLEEELENFGREKASALTYQDTLDKAKKIREDLNLGEDFSIKVDSDELVTITQKLDDAGDSAVSVVQKFKSAEDAIKNFGKAESNLAENTTFTIKSKKEKTDSKKEQSDKKTTESKEEITSIAQAYKVLRDTKEEYLDLDKKRADGSATIDELENLNKIETKIKSAKDFIVNQTSEKMNEIEFFKDDESFKNVFEKARNEIEKLNKEFNSGQISVEEYKTKVESIQKSIKSGKTVDFIEVNNIEQAKDAMNAYAQELSEGAAIQRSMSASGDSITYSWKDQENAVHSLKLSYNELTGAMSAVHNVSGLDGIKNAINQTAEAMKKLQYSGTGEEFGSMFSQASQKVEQLNEKLRAGTIPLEEYERAVKNIQNAIKNDSIIGFTDTKDIDAAKSAMKEYAESVSKGMAKLDETKTTANSLTFEWKDQNGVIQSLTMNYDELSTAITGVVKPLKDGEKNARTFSDRFKQGWINVAQYIASFASFYEVINLIRKGVTVVRDLDTALTEMRKVSDESVQSLKNFQDISFDIASTVGTTAKQIQDSTADWMRLGESLEEASKSAEVSNILLNVSEFENIDDATESLVAMSAAYDDLGKMEIIDKLNNIGNNFSISTDGLATALQKSASALTTAGNDMDQAVALITAGNAVVQDADSVGAGLRTIALRISGTESAREELEEMGESVDDFVVRTSAKSQQVIKDFTKVASNNFQGFDILDDNGNFKSTYDILLGISEIYEEILATDKQYGSNMANGLLETLAGRFLPEICGNTFYRTHLIARIA